MASTCTACRKRFPSEAYFAVPGTCWSCWQAMPAKSRPARSEQQRANRDAAPRKVGGRPLRCAVCEGTLFWKRRTLMNTAVATLFGLDWANRAALNFVCDRCGYVMWFLR